MPLRLTPPTPLEYFASLVSSDADFPLLEAAVSLAQDEQPGLDVQQVLSDIDQLLVAVKCRLPQDAGGLHKLTVLNQFFYQDLHFGGNLNNYYDPDNSYLHRVLETRRGIPISLAVLWLELAQGLGLNARGVGFPGHFLVKINLPQGQVVLDPLSGQSLSREELAERIEPYRRRHEMEQGAEAPLGMFLRVSSSRDIVGRMLRNLKEIHRTQEDWGRLIAVQDRLVTLLPRAWDEVRDRGLAHAELGHVRQALHDLETYLFHVGQGLDVPAIAERMAELRRALN